MESDDTEVSCFQSGAEDKPTFPLEVRQFPARNHRWRATCLAHPKGTYGKKGDYFRSVRSKTKPPLTSPFLDGRHKTWPFFWIRGQTC
jgi:hypothetical protein